MDTDPIREQNRGLRTLLYLVFTMLFIAGIEYLSDVPLGYLGQGLLAAFLAYLFGYMVRDTEAA